MLDDVARRGSGHTPSKSHPDYWDGRLHWVSLKDTFRLDRGLIRETTATISDRGLAHSSAVMHPAGTVVLLRDAGVGKSGVIASDMAVSQHFMAWTCGPALRNWFLYYWLQYCKPEFERISNGSTIKTIGLDYFRLMRIPLPSVNEQDRIVHLLRDADDLLGALEQLITKKCAIKQGMMQELLTGRTRLPGFAGEGTDSTVGSLTRATSGGTPPRENPEYWGGSIPWISAFTMKQTRLRTSDQYLTSAGVGAGSKLAPEGSTLILVRGMALHREVRVGIATRPLAFNQDVKALLPSSDLEPEFLTYSLQAREEQILRLVSSAGSGTGVLDTGRLRRLSLWVPEREEQRRIVAVITDIENEIAALEGNLAKNRAIKQGMMQGLLTRHTRLPSEEVPA